jgi:hypothetical protein
MMLVTLVKAVEKRELLRNVVNPAFVPWLASQ